MLPRLTLLVPVAVLALALLCGCGGGAASSTTSPPSRAEFLERANAGCLRARQGLAQRVKEFQAREGGRWPREVLNAELAHKVLLPTVEEEMEAVRALRAPPGEEERISRILFVEESALTAVVFMTRVASVAAVWHEFAESARALREYGLPECANGPREHGTDV